MGFIDTMRAEGHAVESICRVLREQGCQVAARTYRSWKQPDRAVADRTVTDAIVIDTSENGLDRRRAGPAPVDPGGPVWAAQDDRPGPPVDARGPRGQRGSGDAHPGPERDPPGQGNPDHDPGQGREAGRGSAQPGLHRLCPEPDLGDGLHLRAYLGCAQSAPGHPDRVDPCPSGRSAGPGRSTCRPAGGRNPGVRPYPLSSSSSISAVGLFGPNNFM